MSGVDTAVFTAKAWFGALALDARAIHDEELARARHALAYLKNLIGNDRVRALLASDIATRTARVRGWVGASGGLRIGYTMHQSRDDADGMHQHLRTLLPAAAPSALVDRHMRHFAIEFTSWAHTAWQEAREANA